MKKYWPIFLGAGLGIFALILRRLLHIPDERFISFYLTFILISFLAIFVVNFIWQLLFFKKLAGLTHILHKEKDPDRFIAENEKLLQTVRAPLNRNLISMNICVGHAEKGDYRLAKEILLQIPENQMKGINKVIYNHNLCYFHFLLGENTSGIAVFNANRELFRKFENHPGLGGSIAVNNIYYLIATGEKEQAKQMLDQAKSKFTDPKLEKDLADLEKILS
ncbi:MAG: hypothetical protein KBA53_02525 [Thermoclostridium sp.]|nr:hypothetical protein [Thermoclostridium sp.]